MLLRDEPPEPEAAPYVLPRYLRFARRLALLSGTAAIGIAAGAVTVSTSGCVRTCTGPCGPEPPPPITYPDASHDTGTADATDASAADAADAGAADAAGGDAGDTDGAGGGPRPAPLLPRAWIA